MKKKDDDEDQARVVEGQPSLPPSGSTASTTGDDSMREENPLIDYVALLTEAKRRVSMSVLYKRFIAHTPLDNDIAVWMADFASEQVAKEIDVWSQRLRAVDLAAIAQVDALKGALPERTLEVGKTVAAVDLDGGVSTE